MILDEIAEKTRERVAEAKKKVSFETVRGDAEFIAKLEMQNVLASVPDYQPEIDKSLDGFYNPKNYRFYKALKTPGISFICEAKKASPSKGIIAEDFPYLQIAKDYEAAGASAISCLTEPFYFLGRDEYLKEIASQVTIPVLRKDFTVDPYMIYEAKTLGASAVLLICSLLDKGELKEYHDIATELGLSALVEAHDEKEVEMALAIGASIIGVNNRDLKTFTVDINNSARYRKMVPSDIAFVSESGIKTREDIAHLVENGTDAVLIGETLMRSNDKKAMLEALRP